MGSFGAVLLFVKSMSFKPKITFTLPLNNQIPYYNMTDPFIFTHIFSFSCETVHVLRGRGGRIDGHVGTSQPSEGGFVALCSQRVAAAATAATAADERSGRSPTATQISTAEVQRLGCDFKARREQ